MLAEFVAKIQGLAEEATNIQIVRLDDLRKVIIRTPDGITTEDIPPKDRASTIYSLSDFISAAKDGELCKNPEIFHSDCNDLVLVLSRMDRRETIKMLLEYSCRFQALIRLGQNRTPLSVKDLVRFLRFEMNDCGAEPFIEAIRKLDFQRRSDGSVEVTHGRESLGKSVEAAVQQADSIPQEFTLTVSVYGTTGVADMTKKAIRIGVYIDATAETIELKPLAEEVANAVRHAQIDIGDKLRKECEHIPVFHGEP